MGIDTDLLGNAVVTGYTNSTNFPTVRALQSVHRGGFYDAFVTKLARDGSAVLFSTYLGGSGDDIADAIALDLLGNIHLTGWTQSANSPTLRPFQAANAGGYDAFITKINLLGSGFLYLAHFGEAAMTTEWASLWTRRETLQSPGQPPPPICRCSVHSSEQSRRLRCFRGEMGRESRHAHLLELSRRERRRLSPKASRFRLQRLSVTGFTTSTNFPTVRALQRQIGGGRCVHLPDIRDGKQWK